VLVAKGLLPKPKLLELERAAASLEGSRGQDTASMAKAEQTIGRPGSKSSSCKRIRTRHGQGASGYPG